MGRMARLRPKEICSHVARSVSAFRAVAPRTHARSSSECLSAWRRLGQLSSFRRFEIAASRRVSRSPPVSTSTLRATERLCHSSVRPVPTWTHQSHRARSLFRDLAPSLLVKGAQSSRNRRTIMKVEQAKQIVRKAIEELSQSLERGHSETLRNYLAAIGRFHRYSLRNVMLIASQNPTATHVAGFHTWHKLGRFVKKGERGILILAPIVRAKNQGVEQTETDESSTAVGFRAAYVFDISQTEGQELPEIGNVTGDPREYRDRLGKFVTDQGILLKYSQDIAPARGTSAGGKITLLPGQSPAEDFSTLAPEVAHEMMHRDERRRSTSKRSRETEAEAVAFVVCHAIGLETGSASQDYIQIYDGDAKLLTDSLAHIQKSANQ